MKKVLILLGVFASLITTAQAPQKINYQAVIRSSSGVPITGTAVQLTITISNGSGNFSESQTITSNNVGILNMVIGNGTLLTPSTPLSAIVWSVNPTSLSVIGDIGSGPIPLGSQQLVSVPYALYAETSGSGSSGPAYLPSANISTTGNILDLTSTGVSAGTYGSNVAPNSSIPTFSVDPKGRVISASQYAANTSGDISGTLDNQKVKGLNGIPLSSATPTTGQSLSYNGTNWTPTTPPAAASALWTVGSTTDQVITTNPIANVGVGITTPSNKLDISTPVGFPNNDVQIGSLGSGHALQIFKFASTGNGIFLAMNASSSATAVAIGHAGPGPGITVDVATNNAISASSTGSIATISAQNKTTGPSVRGYKTPGGSGGAAAIFDQTGGWPSETLLATTDGNGPAVRAVGSAVATATSIPLALSVENGHIRAIGPPPTVNNASGGGITVTGSSALAGSSDVAGILSITASGAGLVAGATMDVTMTFNRPYSNPPKVLVTPTTNLQQLAYYISATSPTAFTLRLYIPAGASLGAFASQSFQFNYFIIE